MAEWREEVDEDREWGEAVLAAGGGVGAGLVRYVRRASSIAATAARLKARFVDPAARFLVLFWTAVELSSSSDELSKSEPANERLPRLS